MKRDMDLVRQILLAKEAEESFEFEGYTDEEIRYHNYIMGQAGLLIVDDIGYGGCDYPEAMAISLTWQGHDLLNAMRKETIWKRVTAKFASAGVGMTLDLTKQLAVDYAKQELGLSSRYFNGLLAAVVSSWLPCHPRYN